MSSVKQLKLEEKGVAAQRQFISELNTLVKDIERSEKTMTGLKRELEQINTTYQGPRDTRQDIAYLTGLLDCAKKKLAWEKQIASLQKRAPSLMQRMTSILNDPQAKPSAETQEEMLRALKAVQAAMERLQGVQIQQASEPPAA